MSLNAAIVGTTGTQADVNASNQLKIVNPGTLDANGNPVGPGNYVSCVFEADAGTVTGISTVRQGDISANYRQRVAIDTLLFNETFPGSALNSSMFTSVVATQTVAVASGFLVLNSGSSVATSAVSRVQTYRGFPAYGTYPLQLEVEAVYAATAVQPNNTTEIGFGFASGITAPTDGAYFRYNSAGNFLCVLNYNGTETVSATITPPTVNARHHYIVVIGNDSVEFWVDNILVADLVTPTGSGMPVLNMNPPILLRNYNSSATPPSSAVQIKISEISVQLGDMHNNRPWNTIQAGMGGMAYQGQSGETQGKTVVWTNNTNPTAATPTNTTAALGSGLGGIFLCNAQATAATDFIISSYQVPAMAAGTTSKSLMIKGVRICGINTGAAVATTPTTMVFALAFGHTAVSLATAEGAAAKAPRIVPIGTMTWPVGAAIGATPTNGDIFIQFDCPVLVQPGEFVQVITRFVVGTATASQVINLYIAIDGYRE